MTNPAYPINHSLTRITGGGSKIELHALGTLSDVLAHVLIFSLSVEIPGPYPTMRLPDTDELPEYWYVVDYGTEVGIFADR